MVRNNTNVCEIPDVWIPLYFLQSTVRNSNQERLSRPEDANNYRCAKDSKMPIFPEAVHYLLSTLMRWLLSKGPKFFTKLLTVSFRRAGKHGRADVEDEVLNYEELMEIFVN